MEEIILRSYNKVHTVEQNWYSIGSIKLPAPINPSVAICFFSLSVSILLIDQLAKIPIPGMIKFGIIPYLITRRIKENKKDGKSLIKYYKSYIPFRFKEKIQYERFKPIEKIGKIKFFH